MDRRRFSPSPEGLEGRALLSLFGGSTIKQNTTVSIQDLPKTYKQKELRIAHLPFYLQQEGSGRFLPAPVISQLQTDINSVVASLTPPPPTVINAFNAGLRNLFPQNTLSKVNVRRTDDAFGSVLAHAGATPQQETNLRNDMLSLAKVDSLSIQPSTLARQDYAIVLETTLAVGRPLLTPYAPTLQAKDGIKIDGGRIGLTHDHNPSLVGSYPGGASNDGAIWMQIVDQTTGQVVGTAPVTSAGTYTVKVTSTLPDGKYLLAARSSDEVGHLSYESRPFTLGVKTLPVRHPLTASTTTVIQTSTQPAPAPVVVPTTPAPAPAPAPVTTRTPVTTTARPAAKTTHVTTVVRTTNTSPPGGPLAVSG